MQITGYAFKKDWEEIAKLRLARYDKIAHKRANIIKNVYPGHGQTKYQGDIGDENLSPLDIAILCDYGNTCFGATVRVENGRFWCTVWTD